MKSACATTQTSCMWLRLSGRRESCNISLLLHNSCKWWECRWTAYGRSDLRSQGENQRVCPLNSKHWICLSWRFKQGVPVPLFCQNIMEPLWVQFHPFPPTHELWVADQLTGLDTAESACVEREQPWEKCLPATMETISKTCQPPFQLKSKTMLFYTAIQQRVNLGSKQKLWTQKILALFVPFTRICI